jgi:uncharacterized membrane protein YhhN
MPAVTPIALVVLAAAVSSAFVHLYSEYGGPARLAYVAKPLTTTLLLVVALLANTSERSYQILVVVGLLLSLAGDVFLMLPRDHFMAGLVSFLFAHLAYIVAFANGTGFMRDPWLLLPYLVLAAGVLLVLWPRLGAMQIPVVVYVAALVVMASQAACRATEFPSIATAAAAVGAALFVISDAVLAINRFRASFRAAQAVIMGTYVTAQALIALSTWRTAG